MQAVHGGYTTPSVCIFERATYIRGHSGGRRNGSRRPKTDPPTVRQTLRRPMSPHIGRHFLWAARWPNWYSRSGTSDRNPGTSTMRTIVTWNINSIRRRLHQLERLTDLCAPDVICLQETKCTEDDFPREEMDQLGYRFQAIAGQPAYNGVAILSKYPLIDIVRHDHLDKRDARHISANVGTGDECVRIHSLYIPAGGQIPDVALNPKFRHKLEYVDAVADFFAGTHGLSDAVIVAGDFNIAPLPSDVWDHAKLSRVITHTPIEIAALERMKRALYFIDALRELIPPDNPVFTWWSYRAADWQAANKGRRLDHIWVTAALKDRISEIEVLSDVRHWTPASDHVPVVLTLKP